MRPDRPVFGGRARQTGGQHRARRKGQRTDQQGIVVAGAPHDPGRLARPPLDRVLGGDGRLAGLTHPRPRGLGHLRGALVDPPPQVGGLHIGARFRFGVAGFDRRPTPMKFV